MHEWATVTVPKRWEDFTSENEEGGPWLDANDVNAFVRYLRDYLTSSDVFDALCERLGPVVHLKTRDEAARRRARRKYVQIIMNDFVMNPGPSMTPIKSPQKTVDEHGNPIEAPAVENMDLEEEDFERFGLMASFVQRWVQRLPQALALGAGEHVQIPPGNDEIIKILDPFE